jgi:hypothetical protein
MRMLAGYEEILKEKQRYLSCHISILAFFQSSSGTLASPPVLLDVGGDNEDDPPTVQEKLLPP